jgi:hypothetical protein
MIMGKKRKLAKSSDGGLVDWVSSLAQQASLNSTSKAERIEKRMAKKQQRQKRREQLEAPEAPLKHSSREREKSLEVPKSRHRQARLLSLIARMMKEQVEDIQEASVSASKKPYTPSKPIRMSTRKRKCEISIQPRRSDYGGIGLARPSLWIALDDPSWQPKLEQEFAEHVPGFFGKQRTKAIKKQQGKDMLWRKMLSAKTSHGDSNKKVKGKKLSAMSVDERVEAMLDSGMI